MYIDLVGSNFLSKSFVIKQYFIFLIASDTAVFHLNGCIFFLVRSIIGFRISNVCYKTVPRKETISHAFLNLVNNIQEYNARGI